jgi:pyrroline-5-carboxylate reductase
MKIAIIGGGNMGATYARAFIRSDIAKMENILIIEKHEDKRKALKKENIAKLAEEISEDLAKYEIIFLAVKPQDFRSITEELAAVLKKKQLIISIMAGIKISTIRKLLEHDNIVRAMPNTPAQLGFGITAFTTSESINLEHISIVDQLLETTGKSILMKDEELLDAVTALSGSGPAYFFYFVKYMIEAGKEMGMEEHVAGMLVKQTMLGSFQILNNSKLSIDEMIKSVASKGGTTEAALSKFENADLGNNIIKALKAAEKRAKELSKE